jgi:hypothetical protein
MPRPVSTEPVNEIALTPSDSTSASPISAPGPKTRPSTPSGTPARTSTSTRAQAEAGTSAAGLRMTALP